MSHSPLTDHRAQGRQSGGAGWIVTSRFVPAPAERMRLVSGAGAARPSTRLDPAPQPMPGSAPLSTPMALSAPMVPPPKPAPDGASGLNTDQGFSMPVKPGALRAAGILTKRACAAKTSLPLSRP